MLSKIKKENKKNKLEKAFCFRNVNKENPSHGWCHTEGIIENNLDV